MIRAPRLPFALLGRCCCILTVTTVPAACGAAPSTLQPLDGDAILVGTPAGPGSSGQYLQAGEDGVVYLSWMEPMEASVMASASTRRGAFRMRFATRANGSWSEPRTIAEGENFGVNWASFPSFVRLPNGSLATHYSAGEPGGQGSGGVTLSHDGGATWTRATSGGGGFLRLFPWGNNEVGGIWLNSLEGEDLPVDMADLIAPYEVRTGVWNASGELIAESVLDPMVCSCCQNAAAVADDGPVVLYRGRTREEVRNIMIARYVNGRWTEPRPLHDDGWVIPGCPVNGPSIVARGNRLFAAWFTAPNDVPQVNVKFSEDGGATFGRAYRVDEGDPLGRVDVALLPDGSGLVSWMERTAGDAEIRVRRIDASGRTSPARTVSASTEQRTSGFPRMVAHSGEVYFAWAEPGEPGELRVARASAPVR